MDLYTFKEALNSVLLDESFEVVNLTEEELEESFASNKAHSMHLKYMGWGKWGDGTHATHKNEGGNLIALDAPEHKDSLAPTGQSLNVKDLPASMKKSMTSQYDSTGGDSSPIVRSHEKDFKSHAAFRSHVRDEMSKLDQENRALLVTVNGKPVSMLKKNSSSYGRPDYEAHGEEGQKEVRDAKYPTGAERERARKHRYEVKVRHFTRHTLGKEEAWNSLQGVLGNYADEGEDTSSKEFFKKHNIEVHHVKSDPQRKTARKERSANKPDMQTNYSNDPSGKKEWSGKPAKVQTSVTPEGSMKDIKDKAADKMVDKYITPESPARDHAIKLHKEIGDLINSGAGHREVQRKTEELVSHMYNKGNQSVDANADGIKSDLKSGYSWSRETALKKIRAAKEKKAAKND